MLERFYKNKAIGYWMSVASLILSVIFAIFYPVLFKGTAEYSFYAVLVPIIAVVLTVVLILFGFDSFVPALQLLCTLITLALYIYAVYYYISVVFVGIDTQGFSGGFIFCTAVLLINTVLGVIALFLKRDKV